MKECVKKGFLSLEEANQRVLEIKTESAISNTKPRRAYRCNVCPYYHITSMKAKDFQSHKEVVKERRYERSAEVSYWCKKLKVTNKGEEFQKRHKNKSKHT